MVLLYTYLLSGRCQALSIQNLEQDAIFDLEELSLMENSEVSTT